MHALFILFQIERKVNVEAGEEEREGDEEDEKGGDEEEEEAE